MDVNVDGDGDGDGQRQQAITTRSSRYRFLDENRQALGSDPEVAVAVAADERVKVNVR